MAYQVDPNTKAMRDQFLQSRKNEVSQRANTTRQQGEDALQRRFSSMGAANSGAHISAMQKNQEAANEVARQGEADVNNQALQFAESDAGRGFQSDEAKVQRDFQGALAEKDFAFKDKLSGLEQGNKLKEIDLAERNFLLEKDAQEFNKRMAEIEAASNGKGSFGDKMARMGKTALDPVGALTGSDELGFLSNPINAGISQVIPGGGK